MTAHFFLPFLSHFWEFILHLVFTLYFFAFQSLFPYLSGPFFSLRFIHSCTPIARSPFKTRVRPATEPDRVIVTGNGVSTKGIPASLPTEFLIDTKDAGDGDLQVRVTVRLLRAPPRLRCLCSGRVDTHPWQSSPRTIRGPSEGPRRAGG